MEMLILQNFYCKIKQRKKNYNNISLMEMVISQNFYCKMKQRTLNRFNRNFSKNLNIFNFLIHQLLLIMTNPLTHSNYS